MFKAAAKPLAANPGIGDCAVCSFQRPAHCRVQWIKAVLVYGRVIITTEPARIHDTCREDWPDVEPYDQLFAASAKLA